MLTPPVREATFVAALPTWFQWYIRPAGEYTTFTAFPWIGFVFAGAAAGVAIAAARDTTRARLHRLLALAGAGLVATGLYMSARPPLYAHASFWTSSPTFFVIRVGILMVTLAALYAAEQWRRRAGGARREPDPLARLGQSSLFVYWIHVELVYGYASWWWHRRLPLGVMMVAWLVFSAAMYQAIVLRDRLWKGRRIGRIDTWRPSPFGAGPEGAT
jgi:uncharacterized membrane protein